MNIIDRLLDIAAPHICVGCGSEASVVCNSCLYNLDDVPSLCYACGKATNANKPCSGCVGAFHPQHVWMATTYKKTAKRAIWAFKLEQKRAAACILASGIDKALPYFATPPLISFVPTASSHSRMRGFDHAELLAKELSRLRGWNYVRTLQRTTGAQQRGADRKQRKQQLRGVFRPVNTPIFEGKHVLLIDDVITTGSTLEECTRVLVKAGAAQVDAAVFARTPLG